MAVEETKKNDEAAIQGLLDDCTRSLRDKNIEGVMSIYAQEVVSFDLVPPLRYMGADEYRKRWEEVFLVQAIINAFRVSVQASGRCTST